MIPFQSRVPERQYVKNKPNPVGVKLFVRCGRSGMAFDFEFYQGKATGVSEDHKDLGLGGSIVMCLVENLPEKENFKVYFDNFFSTFQRLTEYEKPTQLHSYSTEENTSMFDQLLRFDTMVLITGPKRCYRNPLKHVDLSTAEKVSGYGVRSAMCTCVWQVIEITFMLSTQISDAL